jgi:hypothetical protein
MTPAEAKLLDLLRRGQDVTFTRHGDGPAAFVLPEEPPEPPSVVAAAPAPELSRSVARRRAWQEKIAGLLTGRRHE